MQTFPWIATAVLVALVFAALAVRAALPPRGPDEGAEPPGSVPLAPLQRVACWTLVSAVAFAAAAVWAIARNGVQTFWNDAEVRLPVTALILAALVASLALWTVALMETFRAAGLVPMAFVVLVFWSCLLVHALALPVGILLGYRRR